MIVFLLAETDFLIINVIEGATVSFCLDCIPQDLELRTERPIVRMSEGKDNARTATELVLKVW